MRKLLIIGLPETGKTTFLAALWHVVEHEEVAGSLVLAQVEGIRTYLNRIREDWLNLKPFGRTEIPAEALIAFDLRDRASGTVVKLWLPEVSGETYRLQWETRQWTAEFDELAAEASGALLFVHPRTVVEPEIIDDTIDKMSRAIGEEGNTPTGEDGSRDESAVPQRRRYVAAEPWSAKHTPTQVKLVEILQFLRARAFRDRQLPIAVIVSAWDLITDGQRPHGWVRTRLPLLAQFLQANAEWLPSEIFGLSAQGGDLSSAGELRRHIKASDRIVVAMPDKSTSHDITVPIKWLLGH